jgi:cytochrome c5
MACSDRVSESGTVMLSARDQLLLASARVVLPPPGVQGESLPDGDSPGAELLTQYCVSCHELPSPAIHSAADWPRVARRMWLRAEGVAGGFDVPVPDAAERLVMLRYLIDNALRVSGAVLPEGAGRNAFARMCSRCHDIPDPKQYSAEEWAPIVRRMIQLPEMALGETTSPEDASGIETYLRTASNTTF